MLKISSTQLNALSAASLDDFKARLLAHLKRVFPESPESDLRAAIDPAIAKANSYGLTTELAMCKFLDLSIIYGAAFDTVDPWLAVFKKADNQPVFEQALDEQYDALLREP